MFIRSSRFTMPLALVLLAAGPAVAQKLDKDERKWFDEARPLMLPDEEKVWKGIKDKGDRQEFQRIFWGRRDPELATPENEYKAEYDKLRAEADEKFRVPGQPGSTTDCGRTYILLGPPAEVHQDSAGEGGVRAPETWTYRGESFQGGKALVSFDADCRAPVGFSGQLDQVAASKIAWPSIDYRKGKDGRIVKLADQLPRDTAARALFKQPREDFPLAVQPYFLRAVDGSTALLGLVRGEAAALAASGEPRAVSVSVAASALGDDGKEKSFSEQTMRVPVGDDGAFVASFKLGVKPGSYSLRTGVVDVKGDKASLATIPIEVPDFGKTETAADGTAAKVPSAGSLMVVRAIESLPPGGSDPAHPLAAFELGNFRFVPLFNGQVKASEQIEIIYWVYNLKVDPATGKADAVAEVSILKDGKTPTAKAPPITMEQETGSSSVGPVPLSGYAPGKYVVRLKVTDKLAKRDVVQEAPLEVLP